MSPLCLAGTLAVSIGFSAVPAAIVSSAPAVSIDRTFVFLVGSPSFAARDYSVSEETAPVSFSEVR